MLTTFWRFLFWVSLTASLLILLTPADLVLDSKVWLAHWLPFGKELDALDATQHSDKWIHLTVFAFLGWLGLKAWQEPLAPRRRVLFGLIFMAVGTECLQYWVPGRSASVADLVADLAGLMVGFLVARAGTRQWSYVKQV